MSARATSAVRTTTAPDTYASVLAPTDAVSVIVKLRGETCDIDCVYCYEKRKEGPGGRAVTEDQIAQLERVFGDRPLAIELHGGEPLTVGKPHMARVLDAVAALPNLVRVTMQTNGVRLDDEWLDLFAAHCPGLELGISFDGDAVGNAWRVDYRGRPTHDRVLAALNLAARRGVRVGVICVVTTRLVGRAEEVMRSLTACPAVRAVSFVPCFDVHVDAAVPTRSARPPASRRLQAAAVQSGRAEWATTPDQYAEFVLDCAHHWIDSGAFRRMRLEPIASVLARMQDAWADSCHFNPHKCHHVFTLYPNGDLGSCDELPWPAARLTRLTARGAEPSAPRAQRRSPLLARTAATAAACQNCDYRATCGGGCAATRLRLAATPHDDYCAHRMRLIDGVAALVASPADEHARACRILRWQPRTPNEMRDVTAFLRTWNRPDARRMPARVRESQVGNINTAGRPGTHEADDLDPGHPQWRAGIEDEVWPLVDKLTSHLGFVTYDSCAGHTGVGDVPPTELRVGLLPRSPAESADIARTLCHAARATATAMSTTAPTHVVVTRGALTSLSTHRRHPTIDVTLRRGDSTSWPAYLAARADAVAALVAALAVPVPATYRCDD